MCSLRPGQKVVLVDDNWRDTHRMAMTFPGVVFPVKGAVYTVREVLEIRGEFGIRVREIHNPLLPYFDVGPQEPAWGAIRFRPVVERKTDISIFRAMLNPSKQPVEA